jgi:mono/diheme cytochrome c family protein
MEFNLWWDAMSDRTSMANLISLGSVCICLLVPAAADADEPIDFSREIRPIFAEHCLHCHGPDAKQRKADLRLDELGSAIAERGGLQAIAPGKPERSTLLERVQSDDPDVQMPPADAGQRRLTRGEIDLLRQWIAQGAKWSAHWSLVAPRRPSLPTVRDATWPRNGIDYFILSRLDREGLRPSTPADPVGLLRRVTQDLTGLPPTIEEVQNFFADDSHDAYEKVVTRLLNSPRYGEHMALSWLDAARYADTSGYQADWERFMWPWRDWVVGANNANLPFDQFTVDQLAGDLLPNATPSQVLATGFNRNHRINDEGGSLDAEFEVEYVVDRVDTTSTVWLGLTAGCARCHDHKYDPISQKEYYRLFAFFNNVPEKGIDGRHGAAKPFIEVPNPAVQARIAVLKRRLETRQATFAQLAEGSPERDVAT